ncbi:hypothetical protein AK812_SmicGene4586 [Symbiodinium microadriaticum]|uniref:Uncharacterized protein n=1 Tax=Symbiodinium microadriaticum TaxID=2951 RepID=A0A1Q9EVW3_SYMMI|nr:hypothetical protein AK812_SmicGene4586 [Symbiodinium microadriaticum]
MATALHESVPPDRWCITRSDLKYLGQEVRSAIQRGDIRPPDDGSDDFDASDLTYGPSIYTVNKQHIMPVTEMFGKVSWALLQHRDGLDCDLFISHAWQEGIFEFLAKVLLSWPADARHAWCCMLANPQNLDIGSLLQSPSSSPFALALKASTYVLVVPNHRCSIYTRLSVAEQSHLIAFDPATRKEIAKVVIPFSDTGLLPMLTDVGQRLLLASGVLFFDLLEVDYAIHVLLAAGMSTPTLRIVARAGVDISGAGYTEIAFPCLDLGPFLIHDLVLLVKDVLLRRYHRWIPCLVCVCARLWLLFCLWHSAKDERCFILKMMSKMIATLQVLVLPTVALMQLTAAETEGVFYIIAISIMLMHIIMVGFACLLPASSDQVFLPWPLLIKAFNSSTK